MGDRGRVARRWPALMVAGEMLGVVVNGVLGSLHATIWLFAWDDVGVCVEEGATLWCLVFACGVGVGASRLHMIASFVAGAD